MIVEKRLELIFSMYLLGRKFKSRVKRHNSDQMLEMVILKTIKSNPSTLTYLAAQSAIQLSAMSEKISVLEHTGLLKRIETDDGRETLVQITKSGTKHLTLLLTTMQTVCTNIFKNLTDQDITTWQKLLNKITVQ